MLPVRVIQRNRCRIHQRLIIQRQSLCPYLACSGITDVILAAIFHRHISPVEGSTEKWRKNFVRCSLALCSIISFSQKILSFVPSYTIRRFFRQLVQRQCLHSDKTTSIYNTEQSSKSSIKWQGFVSIKKHKYTWYYTVASFYKVFHSKVSGDR